MFNELIMSRDKRNHWPSHLRSMLYFLLYGCIKVINDSFVYFFISKANCNASTLLMCFLSRQLSKHGVRVGADMSQQTADPRVCPWWASAGWEKLSSIEKGWEKEMIFLFWPESFLHSWLFEISHNSWLVSDLPVLFLPHSHHQFGSVCL